MQRRCEDWIKAYLEFTENTEPPKIYHKWVAINVIASCLRRKCFIRVGALTFYPNMYIVLVGPPGRCRKGTAMRIGRDMLRDLGVVISADSVTREALVRDLKECIATVDVDGKVMPHCSMTIYSPELAVFLGQRNPELLFALTDWFDCQDEWVYKTVGRGAEIVSNVWVNMIGATTPDLVGEILPSIIVGSGLVSRIIFVYADRKYKSIPYSSLDESLGNDLITDLQEIELMKGKFKYNKDFLDQYAEWYIASEENPVFDDVKLAGYIDRRATHLLKLCMIMSASRSDEMIVKVEDLARAISFLKEVEQLMPQTFSTFGGSDIHVILRRMAEDIATRKKVPVSFLATKYEADVDKFKLDRILATLKAQNFIEWEKGNDGEIWVIYKKG